MSKLALDTHSPACHETLATSGEAIPESLRMRMLVCVMFLLAQMPAFAMDPIASHAKARSSCDLRDAAFDSKEIRCSIEAPGHEQRFRLTVNFSGGHDDTNVWMEPFLGDDVLNCDPGSKTRLVGEDGDISLTCVFSVPAQTRQRLLFRSAVTWSHAQYTSYSFETP